MLSMAKQKGSKLQKLLATWPAGTVFTTSWLEAKGYSRFLLNQYRTSEWLEAVGRGAVARKGDKLDWLGGLYAIQSQLKLPIHLGGKAALGRQGSAHFLGLGREAVTLFAAPGTRLPSWFTAHDWNVQINLYTTNLFSKDLGLQTENVGTFSIMLSSRERSMFELLYLAPQSQSLEEAKLIMGSLTNLRPQLVQSLLEDCSSIKVKRLFMLLAEGLNMPWVRRLNLEKVDFGTGARTLIKGGKTHPKYLLTVPAELFGEVEQ